MTDAPALLSARQRQAVGDIAAAGKMPPSAVPAFIDRVERVISRFAARGKPSDIDPQGAALVAAIKWREEALGRIADQAAQLFHDLDALRTAETDWGFPDRLGLELARFNDDDTGAWLDAQAHEARILWLREQGPARLAETMETLAHLADAARDAQWPTRSTRLGAPPRHDGLLDGLEGAVFEACAPPGGDPQETDWEAAWTPWAGAKKPFGQLVSLALEAAGMPAKSNLHKLISDWQKRSRAEFEREMAESVTRDAGREAGSGPATPA